MFLLCRCGGLRCSIAALHRMGVGRYGLGASPRPPLWIADQVRNDVWHCFHPHLSPLPSRERGLVVVLSCFVPRHTPPCGYCLKASMTGRADVVGVFRFLALLGMTRWQGFVVVTLTPPCGLTSLRSRWHSVCACSAKA